VTRSLIARILGWLVLLAGVAWVTRDVLVALDERIFGLTTMHWSEGVTWWYWNVTTSPFRGIDPFHNDWHGYPVGVDHLSLIGNWGDAAMSAPFFWLFEAPAAYNLTVVAFLLFNGWAAHRLFSRCARNQAIGLAAAVGVFLHPWFFTFIEEGRPTQLLWGWVLLSLAEAWQLCERPRDASIRLLTISITGSFVCFWFSGFFLVPLLVLVVLGTLPALDAEARRVLVRRSTKALLLGMALAFPFGLPLLFDLGGEGGIPGVRFGEMPWFLHYGWTSARLLEPLWPAARFDMSLPWSACAIAIVGLVAVLRSAERRRALRDPGVLGLIGGVAFTWSLVLGPYLWLVEEEPVKLGGESLVALPWAFLNAWVPFYSRLSYPYLVFPLLLCCVVGLATVVLGRLHARGGLQGWVALVLALPFALEMPLVRGDVEAVSSPFAIPEVYRDLAEDDTVTALIEYPFGAQDFRVVYQTVHLKPILGTRGDEAQFLDRVPQCQHLYRQHPGLAALYAYQMSGGQQRRVLDQAALQDLVDVGYGYLVVSEIAWSRSQKLRTEPFEALVADLTWMLGEPDHVQEGLVGFRLATLAERRP